MKVGIVLPNWIGDVVMSTPTLRAIRERLGPDGKMVGVMRPYVADVLAGTSWLDESLFYEKKSKKPEQSFAAVSSQLRDRQLDAMILLTNSLRSAWLAYRSSARRRIGYARNGRSLLLTDRLKAPRRDGRWEPISAVDFYLETAYRFGCPTQSKKLELGTLKNDEAGADQVWSNLDLGEEVVAFNTGGAKGGAKHWPQENYVALARKIVAERPQSQVLILCGPAEQDVARFIEAQVGHPRVRSMADQDLSLGVSKACIKRCQAMVSTDSGPRHIAHAFDVPIVSLFGPIDPRWSETYHDKAITLFHKVPCGPCGKSECPVAGHPCMTGITVERVHHAVQQQLERYSPVRRVA